MKNGLILLFAVLSIFSCKSGGNKEKELSYYDRPPVTLLDKLSLKISEPSGLTLGTGNSFLWIVSDSLPILYSVNIKGEIIREIPVNINDAEGVTLLTDSTIAIIEERNREVHLFDETGKKLNSIELNISGDNNSGIEGIACDRKNKLIFIINEKDPGLLFVFDYNFNLQKEVKLNFAKDYSGLYYEETTGSLWIISDESRLIARCDINGRVLDKFKVDIPQIEGIAVDYPNRKLYLVSDRTEYLYVYRLR